MVDVERSPRSWPTFAALGLAGAVAVGLIGAAAYVVYQAGLEGFKAPPVSSVDLSEPLQIVDTYTTGGSGGDISTWATVQSSADHDASGIADLVLSQALETGWSIPTIDCGGDTPPCRTPEGIVLTDGDGAYLYVYSTWPSAWLGDDDEPARDVVSAWIHLMYEGWGVGRCCDW